MAGKKLDKRLLLWGVESLGGGWIAIIPSTYLAMYMTDIALIPLGLMSAAMLIMSISDFIFATSSGAFISMVRPLKWGRLRSYLLICPPLATIFYVINFVSVPNNPVLSTVIITVGFIVSRALFNLGYAANVSLIPVIAKDQETKTRLSSQRMVGSNAGRMLGNYLTPTIIFALAATVSERKIYPIIMMGAGVVYILTNLIHFRLSKGYETGAEAGGVKKDEDTLSFKTVISMLAKNHQLLITLIIDLASNVAAMVLPTFAVYYYKYVAERPDLTATHMLLIGLAGMTGSLFVRFMGPKVKSSKMALLIIYPIVSIILFSTRFIAHNVYIFMAFNVIVHGATGMTQPFELSLYMDNVAYTKYKTGRNATALIMGISGVTVKIANIIKSVLIPFALITAGYVAGTVTPEVKASIISAYSTIPAIIPLVGFVLLKFFYKLSDARLKEMAASSK